MMKPYVLTGAPSTGKSTLLAELEHRGFAVQPEISREVIREQLALGGDKTPWNDVVGFANLVMQATKPRLAIPCEKTTFVDRGIADNIAYLRHRDAKVPENLMKFDYLSHYEKIVFILPPWVEIFCQDAERQQSFTEAQQLDLHLREVYTALGFSLIEIAPNSVANRAVEIAQYLPHCAMP